MSVSPCQSTSPSVETAVRYPVSPGNTIASSDNGTALAFAAECSPVLWSDRRQATSTASGTVSAGKYPQFSSECRNWYAPSIVVCAWGSATVSAGAGDLSTTPRQPATPASVLALPASSARRERRRVIAVVLLLECVYALCAPSTAIQYLTIHSRTRYSTGRVSLCGTSCCSHVSSFSHWRVPDSGENIETVLCN